MWEIAFTGGAVLAQPWQEPCQQIIATDDAKAASSSSGVNGGGLGLFLAFLSRDDSAGPPGLLSPGTTLTGRGGTGDGAAPVYTSYLYSRATSIFFKS